MASQPAMTSRPMSLEEYFDFEASSEIKHEFVDGELYAFAGASRRHNRIAMNIYRHLLPQTAPPCEIYANDVKLQAASNVVYYPDVMVTCDPDDDDELIVRAPCLVVEVISPNTRTTDLREKLMIYRQIPSLRSYLIVQQDERRVTRHWRDEHGNWWWGEMTGSGSVPIDCLDTELSIDQIYEGV